MSEPETIRIRKTGANMVVPQYLIDEYTKPPTETPEQRGLRIAENNRQWELFEAAVPALVAITDPIAREVLDLHGPDERSACRGCDYSGWEAEPIDWPCRTVKTVAEIYGIELPDGVPTYRTPIGCDPRPRAISEVLQEFVSSSFGFQREATP